MLYNDFDWDKISNRLIDMTKEPNRIFEKNLKIKNEYYSISRFL